jgi:hypothetical protein
MKIFQRILWASENGGCLETTVQTKNSTTIGQRWVNYEEMKDLIFQGIINRHQIVWQKLAAL